MGHRVKSIMNHAYQTMSNRLKVKEEFERPEVLSILLSTIKVYTLGKHTFSVCTKGLLIEQ